tara:strand:+ start:5636 stop:6199 length:564 start_codon:yes stop_codon:yes gene_type:complete
MRRRRFLLATPPALAGALLLGRAAPAKATLAEALDLDTLVARADDIVVAQATGHGSRWQGRRIVTDVTLRVLDALEGGLAPGASFEVCTFGGAVGDVGMQIAGEAVLEDGEEYVLFLRCWHGTRRPVGMAQGALPVREIAGTPTVHPGGGGLSLVRRTPEGTLSSAAPALEAPTPLDELLAAIRARL